MAKTNELPSMRSQPKETPQAAEKKPEVQPNKNTSVTVPVAKWAGGYVRRRHDVSLDSKQAQALWEIQHGLEQREAQLANGRFVSNGVDAIRWILEQVK